MAAFCEYTLSPGQFVLDLRIWIPELVSVKGLDTTVCKLG